MFFTTTDTTTETNPPNKTTKSDYNRNSSADNLKNYVRSIHKT